MGSKVLGHGSQRGVEHCLLDPVAQPGIAGDLQVRAQGVGKHRRVARLVARALMDALEVLGGAGQARGQHLAGQHLVEPVPRLVHVGLLARVGVQDRRDLHELQVDDGVRIRHAIRREVDVPAAAVAVVLVRREESVGLFRRVEEARVLRLPVQARAQLLHVRQFQVVGKVVGREGEVVLPQRLHEARVPADRVLGHEGAERSRVRPPPPLVVEVQGPQATGNGVPVGQEVVRLAACLADELRVVEKVAEPEQPVDVVARLLVRPPLLGGRRDLAAGPAAGVERVPGRLDVAGQARALPLEELSDPAVGLDLRDRKPVIDRVLRARQRRRRGRTARGQGQNAEDEERRGLLHAR